MCDLVNACRVLGTFTYHDVRNELKKRTAPRSDGRYRRSVGTDFPTERQIIQTLSRASWCVEVSPPGKHTAAVYRYSGPGSDDSE
jgi:hypothetical protein